MYNVIIKNVWSNERQIADTAPSAYLADRIAARTMRQLDAGHIAYMEPADGWEAETKRAEAIEADWAEYRQDRA